MSSPITSLLLLAALSLGFDDVGEPVGELPKDHGKNYTGQTLDITFDGVRYHCFYMKILNDNQVNSRRIIDASGIVLLPWEKSKQPKSFVSVQPNGGTTVEVEGFQMKFSGRPLVYVPNKREARILVHDLPIPLEQFALEEAIQERVLHLLEEYKSKLSDD